MSEDPILLFFESRIKNFLYLHTDKNIFYDLLTKYKKVYEYKKKAIDELKMGKDHEINSNSVDFYRYDKLNSIFDSTLYHINSGGYGFIFRLNKDYCAKITLHSNNDYNFDWIIPNDIKKILKKKNKSEFLNLLNIPLCIFENKFFYGLIQFYMIQCMIFYLINYIMLPKHPRVNIHTIINQLETITSANIKILYNKLFIESPDKELHLKLLTIIFFDLYKEVEYPLLIFNNFNRFVDLLNRVTDTRSVFNFALKNQSHQAISEELINTVNALNLVSKKDIDKIISINKNLKYFIGNLLIENLAYGNINAIYIDSNMQIISPNTNGAKRAKNVEKFIKLFLTQVLLGVYIFNKETGFLHNDLKPENVLVFPTNEVLKLNLNDKISFIFSEKLIFKINDFDFSKTKNVKNKLIADSTINNINNIFGDIHYLFVTLFSNQEYITKYKNIYVEYYRNLIENRCDTCDKNYNKKIKNNLSEHISNGKIDFNTIESFLSNSFIFDNWRFVKKNM